MLFHSPEPDSEEREVIDRIERLRRNLGFSLQTPTRWHGLMRRVVFAQAVRGSNSIEGYIVSVDDAVAAVDGDKPMDAESETWAAHLGYQAAMTYVLQLADDPHFSYSLDLIRSLHFMMQSYDLSKNPGRWRPGSISVIDAGRGETVYQGPPAHSIHPLMTELVEELNGPEEPGHNLIKAAMAHLNLAMIRPFSDGNGRMARCLQTLVLARIGILAPPFSNIEEYLGRNTLAYYAVLAEVGQRSWNPENDARPWIHFCLTAHYKQVATLIRRQQKIRALWDRLEEELRKKRLPSRMIVALAEAALGLRIRNSGYRLNAGIAPGLASRDLKTLVEYGMLVPQGERRGRFYLASPEIRNLGRSDPQEGPVPNPFDLPPEIQ